MGVVLYIRYPIVARALGLAALGRVRRASKGILHTRGSHKVCKQLSRQEPKAFRLSDNNYAITVNAAHLLYTRYPIVARRAWPTDCIGYTEREVGSHYSGCQPTAQYYQELYK